MGNRIQLTASDGHELSAYRADPTGPAKGAVVVIQEIFGVNSHIRSVCDRLAEQGWVAIAPALFDRIEPGFESGYSNAEVEHARGFIAKVDWDKLLLDCDATRRAVSDLGPVTIMGFCLGGSAAFLCAARQDGWSAAICYYGGRIAEFADETPRCPTQMHFGAQDHAIPMTDVETVQAKRADCEIHVYDPAGHGFHCDERASFHADSAVLAWQRSLQWLTDHS